MAAASKVIAAPKPVRCAIYTRKSTDEGLNKEFNSLDAQREAAEAYIQSQRHEGWTLLPTHYSDGGYTGANMERPGVRQLLADIEAGKVDCVVVYKVDRLSRSLIDFGRMMEMFEKNGVCFVSITQQFITSSAFLLPPRAATGLLPTLPVFPFAALVGAALAARFAFFLSLAATVAFLGCFEVVVDASAAQPPSRL